MRHTTATLILAGSLAFGSSALAQDNSDLTCKDLVMAVSGEPDSIPLTVTIPLDDFVKQCSAIEGATLTLTTPNTSVTVSPEHGSSEIIAFVVKDSKGRTATANLIVTRN
jgi:hypothetical protein